MEEACFNSWTSSECVDTKYDGAHDAVHLSYAYEHKLTLFAAISRLRLYLRLLAQARLDNIKAQLVRSQLDPFKRQYRL